MVKPGFEPWPSESQSKSQSTVLACKQKSLCGLALLQETLLCHRGCPLPAHGKCPGVLLPDLLAGCCAAGTDPCIADPFPWESLGRHGGSCGRNPGQPEPPEEMGQTDPLCYHVPYSSLTMFLGGSQADRDSATSYRMSVEVLSTLLGSSIQGQIVGSHHAVLRKSCNVGNSTLGNNTALLSETLENTRRAYLVASFVLGSIYCFSCFVLFLGVKERADPSSSLEKTRHSFWGNLHMLLGYKPYNRLLCGFLLASLAFQLIQGIFALFCTYVSGLAGRFQHLVLIMLVVTCLSIRIWQCFLEKFGKKTAVFVGLSLIIPALIVITVGSHSFLLYSFMVAMAGSSLAVLYLLPWSMLPDAVDDFKLRNPACLDPEPLFYSFYIFVNKFAGGLSLGISTMSLHFAGYRATDCTHNPKVMLTLQILMAPVPIALMLLAMAVFCSYPINEERRKQIKMEKEPASTWKEHSESKAIYCKHRREERNSFASCCEGEI
ncbi:sodium-dependent lysophosphatidylcholine symporter 1-like isoform X4 [Sceloporus undulatus]|uniref:sodium-dependent lysophosphatidylcholine symporter 1-like isoform X4 n=1 Tax=Sceloporus undulatus TaxID=8520 RepID=UPI001C4BD74D|nr:sodium-dependent lysophosphatidylcholine symporter 1-like isoform X4 [Sceloporus undulatus]